MKSEKEKYINSVNLYVDTDFPYLVLDVIDDRSYPRNPGFQVMHWHEDLQFIYVLGGSIEVKTLDNTVSVQAGEGIFINKNVVHFVRRTGECHYNSFIFPAQFLEFSFHSPAKLFVDVVVENEQFSLFHFTSGEEWQEKALMLLCRLSELSRCYSSGDTGAQRLQYRRERSVCESDGTDRRGFYVYEVLVLLSALWLTMRKNILLPPKQQESTVSMRMQKFLRCIEQHYPEDLTLEDAEPLACVINGAQKIRVNPAESVCVIGAGPVGLLFIQLLKAAGAKPIIAVEPNAMRRDYAIKCGADVCVDPMAEDVREVVKELTQIGVDYAIDVVGNQMPVTIDVIRKGGTCLLMGNNARANPNIVQSLITYKEAKVLGTWLANASFGQAVKLLDSGLLNLEFMITHTLPLEEIHEAIDLLRRGEGVEVLVDPNL